MQRFLSVSCNLSKFNTTLCKPLLHRDDRENFSLGLIQSRAGPIAQDITICQLPGETWHGMDTAAAMVINSSTAVRMWQSTASNSLCSCQAASVAARSFRLWLGRETKDQKKNLFFLPSSSFLLLCGRLVQKCWCRKWSSWLLLCLSALIHLWLMVSVVFTLTVRFKFAGFAILTLLSRTLLQKLQLDLL